jgi:hypothetical protein
MKIQTKLPKFNESLHLEFIKNEWVPMKEPKHLVSAILLSIPLMIINALISIGVITIFSTISLQEFGLTANSISISINFGSIFLLVLVVIIHELLHLIFIPNFIKSKNTIFGLTWFGGFAATEDKIIKSRYILITIAPFIIISVILPFILSALGLLTSTFKFLVLINAMASSVDILNLLFIVKQVPKNGVLKSNGPKTYWNVKQSEREI